MRSNLIRIGGWVACGLFLVVCLSLDLGAQPPPPSLPGMPDQAPIDGGLGLLAAGGAAYAWKRLRGRSPES